MDKRSFPIGLLILSLVASACSSDPAPASSSPDADAAPPSPQAEDAGPPDPGYGTRSGSRLRLSALVAPGGAYVDVKVRDEKFGDCEIRATTDDVIRCIPHNYELVLFTDAQCTQPIVMGDAACMSTFAMVPESAPPPIEQCQAHLPPRARVFRVGNMLEKPPAETWASSGADCTKLPGGPLPGMAAFSATPAVLDELAALELRNVTVGRFAVKMLRSADGMRVPRGLADAAVGAPCSFARTADGEVPAIDDSGSISCLPGTPAEFAVGEGDGASYADADCATPAATFADFCGQPPALARVYEPKADACTAPRSKVHAIGQRLDSAYVKKNDACVVPGPEASAFSYWQIGAPAELTSYPVATRTLVGDALRVYAFAIDGQTVMQEGFGRQFFVDGKHFCYPMTFADGTYCVPETTPAVPSFEPPFADDACTQPAIAVSTCAVPPAAIEVGMGTACTLGTRVAKRALSLGARLDTAYVNAAGDCTPIPPADGVAHYALGAEVNPASVFVRLERKDL